MKEDLEKVTVRLFRGDKDEIDAMFPNLGHNRVIRQLVRNLLKGIKERAQKTQGNLEIQIDVDQLMTEEKND